MFQMSKAIVYIEEMDSVADVTFPAVPQVVSLLNYDDTERAKVHPNPPTGYPVVCVTVSFTHTHTHSHVPLLLNLTSLMIYFVSQGLQSKILRL